MEDTVHLVLYISGKDPRHEEEVRDFFRTVKRQSPRYRKASFVELISIHSQCSTTKPDNGQYNSSKVPEYLKHLRSPFARRGKMEVINCPQGWAIIANFNDEPAIENDSPEPSELTPSPEVTYYEEKKAFGPCNQKK